MSEKPDYSKIKLLKGRVSTPYETPMIGSILDKVAKKLKLNDNYEDFEIMNYWSGFLKEAGSEGLVKYTFAHRISKDRKLVIGIRSAVIANELQFIKGDLEKSFLDKVSAKFKKTIRGLIFELRS